MMKVYKSKGVIYMALIFTTILVLVICVTRKINYDNAKKNAENLATLAEAEFIENEKDSYVELLRGVSGFNDLSVETTCHYIFENDYNSQSKTLKMTCNLILSSDIIDRFYTTNYDDAKSERLVKKLNKLKEEYTKAQYYTYRYPEGVVEFAVFPSNTNEFSIISHTSGHIYRLSYYSTYDVLQIDGKNVYMAKERELDYPTTVYHDEVRCYFCSKVIMSDGEYIHCKPIYNGGVVECDYCGHKTSLK